LHGISSRDDSAQNAKSDNFGKPGYKSSTEVGYRRRWSGSLSNAIKSLEKPGYFIERLEAGKRKSSRSWFTNLVQLEFRLQKIRTEQAEFFARRSWKPTPLIGIAQHHSF
jgi:hypothetical protein